MRLTRSILALAALPLALAACAPKTVASVATVAPEAIPPRPVSPVPAYGTLVLPVRDADGSWWTPNQNLQNSDAIWHLRAALNVAALRCTGADAAAIAASYNAMLKADKAPIDKAYKAVRARYKAADANTWQTSFDVDSTKLYNFFAQPAVKPAFCAAAAQVSAQVGGIKPVGFGAFAAITLASLDKQFTDFYDAYAGWQVAAADWDAKYGPAPIAAPKPIVTAAAN